LIKERHDRTPGREGRKGTQVFFAAFALAKPKLAESLASRIIHELFQRLGPFASKTVGASRRDRTKNAA